MKLIIIFLFFGLACFGQAPTRVSNLWVTGGYIKVADTVTCDSVKVGNVWLSANKTYGADSSIFKTAYSFKVDTATSLETGTITPYRWAKWNAKLDQMPFDSLTLSSTTLTNPVAGSTWYNNNHLNTKLDIAGVTLQHGFELYSPIAFNNSGSPIVNGSVVKITGAQGDKATIGLARADTRANCGSMIGVITHTAGNMSEAIVTKSGSVAQLNTNSYSVGDTLYLSTTVFGGLTNVKPTTGIPIRVGYVTRKHANEGVIDVDITFMGDIRSTTETNLSGILTGNGSTVSGSNHVISGNNLYRNSVAADSGYLVKKEIDQSISFATTGQLEDRGSWDASGNTFPTTGGSGIGGAVVIGDKWTISVGGIVSGDSLKVGDIIIALVNTPGQTLTNWNHIPVNQPKTVLLLAAGDVRKGAIEYNGRVKKKGAIYSYSLPPTNVDTAKFDGTWWPTKLQVGGNQGQPRAWLDPNNAGAKLYMSNPTGVSNWIDFDNTTTRFYLTKDAHFGWRQNTVNFYLNNGGLIPLQIGGGSDLNPALSVSSANSRPTIILNRNSTGNFLECGYSGTKLTIDHDGKITANGGLYIPWSTTSNQAILIDNSNAGTGIRVLNSETVSGTGLRIDNTGFRGLFISGSTTGTHGYINCLNNGVGLQINTATQAGYTNKPFQITYGDTLGLKIERDGTVVFSNAATVWDDVNFPIVIRTTGTNIPSIATMQGNLTGPQWAVNDYAVCEKNEIPHGAVLGANTYQWHVHLETGGTNVDNRYVAFEIEWTYANSGAQFGTPTTISSGDLLIPANTPANTHLVFNVGNPFSFTNQGLGVHVKPRLKRVASTGTAPTVNPFCEMIQIHYESDMVGSRTATSK